MKHTVFKILILTLTTFVLFSCALFNETENLDLTKPQVNFKQYLQVHPTHKKDVEKESANKKN